MISLLTLVAVPVAFGIAWGSMKVVLDLLGFNDGKHK